MGVGVSGWPLARAVAIAGELGVVSGTLIDTVMIRRLQDGDPGGDVRRALKHFPIPALAAEAVRRYFREGGRSNAAEYRLLPLWRSASGEARKSINMLAAFVEVFLAKEGHAGMIGINLLTKIQLPNLSALYGAMLAGVDYVLMGAGIPREIPVALDRLAEHGSASLRFEVEGWRSSEPEVLTFDPSSYWTSPPPAISRPKFLAIVSGDTLATVLARKTVGRIDGFIVEGHIAGGHNAPPRGRDRREGSAEPQYDGRDEANLEKIAALGLPFWLAGGMGEETSLASALGAGATGIQVGTLFAYCRESGMDAELKLSVLEAVRRGEAAVRTDARASPTGFPFKLVEWPGRSSQEPSRKRICDLGYLRTAYLREDGRIGYRCPAEPVEDYLRKGGKIEDTEGRRCLCNGLMATVGLGQPREDGEVEPPLVTSGNQLEAMGAFIGDRLEYGAQDVVDYLLGRNAAIERPAGQR
jgi:NAD(P)H-dependent flavin oxidoreductase YrpB (nitropropane dioxygenase family)